MINCVALERPASKSARAGRGRSDFYVDVLGDLQDAQHDGADKGHGRIGGDDA